MPRASRRGFRSCDVPLTALAPPGYDARHDNSSVGGGRREDGGLVVPARPAVPPWRPTPPRPASGGCAFGCLQADRFAPLRPFWGWRIESRGGVRGQFEGLSGVPRHKGGFRALLY